MELQIATKNVCWNSDYKGFKIFEADLLPKTYFNNATTLNEILKWDSNDDNISVKIEVKITNENYCRFRYTPTEKWQYAFIINNQTWLANNVFTSELILQLDLFQNIDINLLTTTEQMVERSTQHKASIDNKQICSNVCTNLTTFLDDGITTQKVGYSSLGFKVLYLGVTNKNESTSEGVSLGKILKDNCVTAPIGQPPTDCNFTPSEVRAFSTINGQTTSLFGIILDTNISDNYIKKFSEIVTSISDNYWVYLVPNLWNNSSVTKTIWINSSGGLQIPLKFFKVDEITTGLFPSFLYNIQPQPNIDLLTHYDLAHKKKAIFNGNLGLSDNLDIFSSYMMFPSLGINNNGFIIYKKNKEIGSAQKVFWATNQSEIAVSNRLNDYYRNTNFGLNDTLRRVGVSLASSMLLLSGAPKTLLNAGNEIIDSSFTAQKAKNDYYANMSNQKINNNVSASTFLNIWDANIIEYNLSQQDQDTIKRDRAIYGNFINDYQTISFNENYGYIKLRNANFECGLPEYQRTLLETIFNTGIKYENVRKENTNE